MQDTKNGFPNANTAFRVFTLQSRLDQKSNLNKRKQRMAWPWLEKKSFPNEMENCWQVQQPADDAGVAQHAGGGRMRGVTARASKWSHVTMISGA